MSPLLFPVIGKIIETVGNFIDPTKKAEAQLAILQLQQAGEFKELELALEEKKLGRDTIIAEATSSDKWTSRARPSFMYVMYTLILASIPMGFLSAFEPHVATQVATGAKEWLAALPSELYALFGAGYVGYVYVRGQEKKAGVTK